MRLDATWPVLLEGALKAAGHNVEIINAGVPGYSTTQQTLYLERLLPLYNPHLVVLVLMGHDFFTNAPIIQRDGVEIPKPGKIEFVRKVGSSKQSAFYSLTFAKRMLMKSDALHKSLYLMTPRAKFFASEPPPLFHRQIAITKDLLTRADRASTKHASRFAVLSVPQFFQVLLAARGTPEEGRNVRRIDTVLGAVATAGAFTWISTLDDLADTYRSSGSDLYFRFDGHMNAAGNKVLADIAVKRLEKTVMNAHAARYPETTPPTPRRNHAQSSTRP